MASAWLYKFVLVEDVAKWIDEGWRVVGPGPCLGGWESLMIRRPAAPGPVATGPVAT